MAISEQEFEQAQARAAETRQAGHAVAARYDRKHGRVVVKLHNDVELAVPVGLVEGLADATPDMLFTTEEIFGPVAPIYKFETEQEAIDLANNTQFGLASYFYTQDLGRVFRVSEGLKYGMVGVNEGMITTVEAPFGGLKESGLGKEGGHQGIEDYLDTKYICVGGLGL